MSEHHLDFLTRFALTAILGSATIILVAPFLRPAVLPDWLAEPSKTVRAYPTLDAFADRLADALLWSPNKRPAPPSAAAPGTPSPVAATEASRWGIVVAASAPAYRSQGQFWQRLPAATVVTVHGLREASVGPVAVCRLPPPASPGAAEFLVRRDQLDLHDGSLDAVSPELLERLQHHARLRGELETVKTAANSRDRTDNPQWNTYERARAAYNRSAERARGLRQRFDSASGDERMKLADELRSLKTEEVRLTQELAAARRAYDAWNAAHPVADLTADPRVQALESELASLSAMLPPSGRAP